jgi:dihydrodipicolinate synthase/N-acetylneuraminate lyase
MLPPLQGIIPPLVTPLADRDELDIAGLERLVSHVTQGGVHGLFILGTTGEAPSLSYRLRRELIDRVCGLVRGQVPILVGITDTSFIESVSLARHAADAGADALVVALPYYFPAGQTELTEYIEHLVPELPLPLMLYNMPAMTKIPFEIETLRGLTQLDGIAGIKDSGGDLSYFSELVKLRSERPDWRFFMGPENLLVDAVNLGGDGGVNGGANLFPKLFVDLYNAAATKDLSAIAQLQMRANMLQQIYEIGKYASRHIKATKSALSILGICSDFMAEPFHRFKQPERAKVEAVIEAMGRGNDYWPLAAECGMLDGA